MIYTIFFPTPIFMKKQQPKTVKNSETQRGAQSIHRAIHLLRVIASHNERGIRLSELAKATDIHIDTTRRIIKALVSEAFVDFNAVTKQCHSGIDFFLLGSAAHQFAIRDHYHSALERIADHTGDTAYLMIRSGNDVLCIDRVMGPYPIQVLSCEIGERRPMGRSGESQAILAALTEQEAALIISANERFFTARGDHTENDIKAMVNKSRELGYGLGAGNANGDSICVGLCICNSQGNVQGAVSVAGIGSRMNAHRQKEIAELIKDEISYAKLVKES
jgi:DNA-binding IclR family transcriptional regulator